MLDGRNVGTEITLIQRAQDGDREAYGDLVRLYYTDVVNIVYHMCSDNALAEDAAQEAFIRAWVKLPSFRLDSSLRNWLYRIALNAALDVLRRKSERFSADGEMQRLPDEALGPEAALIEKEQAAYIQQALRSLPQASRSVLVLREYSGLSYEEIATVLEIPIGTVMSRLNYARNRLRGCLAAQMIEQEQENA